MKPTRRTLLRLSATTAASYRQILGANDRIRVALIGTGGMGRGDLREFLKVRGVECVGLCDVDAARLGAAEKEVRQQGHSPSVLTKDFRRIAEMKELEAVVIGATDNWHALPTITACQAGKDVYVEKPLSPTIGEDEAMAKAARKYDRVVQAGTQYRSAPHFADAVEYIRSGKLGRISLVRVFCYLDWMHELPPVPDSDPPAEVDYDFWLGPAPKRPFNKNRFHFHFRWYWDYAAGLLGDWGVHLLDIALWGMGAEPPETAASAGGKFSYPADARETPDTQTVTYTYPTYTMIWEHSMGHGIGPVPDSSPTGVAFYGSEGLLVTSAAGWRVYPETVGTMVRDRSQPRRFKGTGVPFQPSFGDPRGDHVRNFLDCMRSRKRPNADIEICQKTMLACHLGNIAFRVGRQVRWDAEKRRIVNDPEAQTLVTRSYRAPWRLPEL